MTDDLLEKMGISADQARVLTRFFEAYANTCIADIEDPAENISEKPEEPPPVTEEQFALRADAAVSLREAAQWCLYTDVNRSAQLLEQSGEQYWHMGQPFGLYLQAISGTDVDRRRLQESISAMILMTEKNQPDTTVIGSSLQQSVAHPQQQAYLMLAYGGLGAPSLEALTNPYQMMRDSPHSSGVVPVGALGTPIHRLWTIAMHLAQRGDDALDVIAYHLGLMCQRYQETMQLAQYNRYLWQNGASPVEVGDIDIAGIAALVTIRLDGTGLLRLMENLSFSALFQEIGMAPVEAGVELANHGAAHPN